VRTRGAWATCLKAGHPQRTQGAWIAYLCTGRPNTQVALGLLSQCEAYSCARMVLGIHV